MKAIIIEDEKNAVLLLEQMLKDIEPRLLIADICGELPAGVKSIKKYKPDIVFLDIELPVYSGIQLLDFFNPEEITFDIIFTTASNEYAIRAFEMSAVDYLMKPIQEEKLKAAIEKLLRRKTERNIDVLPILKENLQNGKKKKIVVPVVSGFEVLNLENICYFKAEGSYTQISFQSNNNLLVSKNLKHFEFILEGQKNFIRIHRSFIVNINFIKKIMRKDGVTVLINDKIELPVSEDKTERLIELLEKM